MFSLVMDMVAVSLGSLCGTKLSEKINMNLSWIGGVILIALAFVA